LVVPVAHVVGEVHAVHVSMTATTEAAPHGSVLFS
jgi:hypothetical protein